MATNDPTALLERLRCEPSESEWLEFKVNNADPQMLGKRISACANSAILAGKDRAFIVFGVEDQSRAKVGTNIRLSTLKKGNENFQNWISHMIEPRLFMEFLDFEIAGKNFSIIAVEPTYDRPVKFAGTEFIRVGENTKRLSQFPAHERSIWFATGRRKFEDGIALSNQSAHDVVNLLDVASYYRLRKEPMPRNDEEIIRRFCTENCSFLRDNLEGKYDITNLGAILLAKELRSFPTIARKSIRVIKYAGKNKSRSDNEYEEGRGYAPAFSDVLRYIMGLVPKNEIYVDGVRTSAPVYPEDAIREILANALIHQDFTVQGASPVVEMYSDRLEVTNPGNSLIEVDRILDGRQSRNEKLASVMRDMNLCEERGGGLDKALLEMEKVNLPAPEFNPSSDSMRVVVFGPRSFSKLSKTEKIRACFFHCVLRWLEHDYMSNTTLRQRFSLKDEDYQAVSVVISASIKLRRIVPAEKDQGRRNAKYVPYCARDIKP